MTKHHKDEGNGNTADNRPAPDEAHNGATGPGGAPATPAAPTQPTAPDVDQHDEHAHDGPAAA